jgi:hypothetical protein
MKYIHVAFINWPCRLTCILLDMGSNGTLMARWMNRNDTSKLDSADGRAKMVLMKFNTHSRWPIKAWQKSEIIINCMNNDKRERMTRHTQSFKKYHFPDWAWPKWEYRRKSIRETGSYETADSEGCLEKMNSLRLTILWDLTFLISGGSIFMGGRITRGFNPRHIWIS